MQASFKKHKKPILAGLLLLLLFVGYFTREKWTSWFKLKSNTQDSPKPSYSTASTTINRTKVLKKGDRGVSVKELQRLLNLEYEYQKKHGTVPIEPKLVEDQIFGAKTQAMLQLFTGKSSISIKELLSILKNQKSSPSA